MALVGGISSRSLTLVTISQPRGVAIGDNIDVTACAHHWVIETPRGPTSIGVCKLCGQWQEFRNSSAGTGWEREVPSERAINAGKPPLDEEEEQEDEASA